MKSMIRVILQDIAGLAGASAISYGAWRIYEPAGFIVGGILLLAFVLLVARG